MIGSGEGYASVDGDGGGVQVVQCDKEAAGRKLRQTRTRGGYVLHASLGLVIDCHSARCRLPAQSDRLLTNLYRRLLYTSCSMVSPSL